MLVKLKSLQKGGSKYVPLKLFVHINRFSCEKNNLSLQKIGEGLEPVSRNMKQKTKKDILFIRGLFEKRVKCLSCIFLLI